MVQPRRHVASAPSDAPRIRKLPGAVVNRIAAGEVIERPASVVKELAENALDAGASRIEIRTEGGGQALIAVEDDGSGMTDAELALALERHATSKLDFEDTGAVDLLNIASMGFRGEALPSIASVAHVTIAARPPGGEGAAIESRFGAVAGPRPSAFAGLHGCRIEVRDLFRSTPARLKFLKSERAENAATLETVKRLALARPDAGFALMIDGRKRLSVPPGQSFTERAAALLGEDFAANSIAIEAEREGIALTGLAGLPTFNRGGASVQFLDVNGRPVRDRMLTGCLRAAYQDLLARDRHPCAALQLTLPAERVDVNVHPAKTEVRFREAALVRGLLISGLRHALAEAGHRASSTIAAGALGMARPSFLGAPRPSLTLSAQRDALWSQGAGETGRFAFSEPSAQSFEPAGGGPGAAPGDETPLADGLDASPLDAFPLGAARAQLHENYIVAQTAGGIVIVDQHAAHERLVLDAMRRGLEAGGVPRQALLMPEVIGLEPEDAQAILERAPELAELGLTVEPFGPGAVAVTEIPALLPKLDVKGLIGDLLEDMRSYGEGMALKEKLDEVCANMACRAAVKSGRRLTLEEMNALLRQMEATPYSGQCNHGRPTYVELKLADIERLFGRR